MVRGRVLAALAAVYVVWGSTYLAIKHMVTGFPPQLGTGIRFLVAGAVLYVLTARHSRRLSRRQWRSAFEVGILLIVGGVGAVTIAESYGVGSGVAATAAAAIPLWTVVLGAAYGKRPGSTEWWGIGAGLGGVGLLSLGGDFSANPLGLVLLLVAPISWAIGSVRRGGLDLPAGLRGVAAEMLAGGAVLLVVGAARGERFTSVPRLGAWLGLAYLIVFGSLVAFSAYMYLLDHLRPALATSYAYVNPAIAVLLGVTLGAETPRPTGLVALPLILGGVALVSGFRPSMLLRASARRRPPSDEFEPSAPA